MWKCKNCGENIEDEFDACWSCGTREDGSPPSNPELFDEINEELQYETDRKKKGQENKYPVLITLSSTFKIIALLNAVVAVIGVIASLSVLDSPLGFLTLAISLIGGLVSFVILLATSELIKVFMDIEKNTRLALNFKRRGGKR